MAFKLAKTGVKEPGLSLRVSRRWSARLSAGLCAVLLVIGSGCTGFPSGGQPPDDTSDGDNGSPTDSGEVAGQINNITTNIGISALQRPIAVLYSVTGSPDSISGFYVPVADNSPSAGPIGDRVIVAVSLPAGADQAFDFDPVAADVGFFRVGILIAADGMEFEALSSAVIRVEGVPAPFFIRPTEAIKEVVQGEDVIVSFDAGDPEGDVQWRLFFLSESDPRSSPLDELGTEIATDSGNVGLVTFLTAALVPGDHQLGVSATDSGFSIAATVAAGEADRIVTVFGPIIRVSFETP